MFSIDVNWFSIDVNWQDEKWNFIGQSVYNEAHEKDKDFDESNEMGTPMMNYAFPLDHSIDEYKILDIVENTNCTVVEDIDTGKYYLALTGGGMDLSQDIALAYIKAQGFIGWDLIDSVYYRSPLSVGGADYKLILKDLKRLYEIQLKRSEEKLKELDQLLK